MRKFTVYHTEPDGHPNKEDIPEMVLMADSEEFIRMLNLWMQLRYGTRFAPVVSVRDLSENPQALYVPIQIFGRTVGSFVVYH